MNHDTSMIVYIAYLFGGLCILGGVWYTLKGIWWLFKAIYSGIDLEIKNREKKKHFDEIPDYFDETTKKHQ